MEFIEWALFAISDGTQPFTKCSQSILFARSCDVIYWNLALPRYEKEFDHFQNAPYPYDLKQFNIIIIEWELFDDKRRNLIISKMHLIHLI
jgi:hypothetical protein